MYVVLDGNVEEALYHKADTGMFKKMHVLNISMKRAFSHAFFLHVHTFSKEISVALRIESALCCVAVIKRNGDQFHT